MLKIDAHFRLFYLKYDQPRIEMINMDAKLAEMIYLFKVEDSIDLRAQFTRLGKVMKTNPQLGYLFGYLGVVALQVLQEMGWTTITDKYKAVKFVAGKYCGFIEEEINEITGEVETSIKSIADSEKEEIDLLIKNIIVFLLESGAEVTLPEEYFKTRRL